MKQPTPQESLQDWLNEIKRAISQAAFSRSAPERSRGKNRIYSAAPILAEYLADFLGEPHPDETESDSKSETDTVD